jgi:peroxiredoxin
MAVGSPAPDFVVRDVEGRTHSLGAMGQGRVLVLFWSSTCVHCRELIPDLYRWFEEEQPADIQVVSLSIDSSAEAFAEFLEQHPLPLWINVHEAGGWQGKVAGDYHVYATPTMYVLDGEGIITNKPKNLKQLLRALR